MSDPTAQEPTMEEILASIRRIISEDDAPAAEPPKAEAAPPPPTPEPVAAAPAAPAAVHEEYEEVLELTEPAQPESHGDLEVVHQPPPVVHTPPEPAPPPAPAEPAQLRPVLVEDDALLSHGTEDQIVSHFGRLAQNIAMPAAGHTLEDVVRELLRPLLKSWLDEHLPAIVEEKVQAEVERVSRRRA